MTHSMLTNLAINLKQRLHSPNNTHSFAISTTTTSIFSKLPTLQMTSEYESIVGVRYNIAVGWVGGPKELCPESLSKRSESLPNSDYVFSSSTPSTSPLLAYTCRANLLKVVQVALCVFSFVNNPFHTTSHFLKPSGTFIRHSIENRNEIVNLKDHFLKYS